MVTARNRGADLNPRIDAYFSYSLLKDEMVGPPGHQRQRSMYRGRAYNCVGENHRSFDFFLWDGEAVQTGMAVDHRNLQLLKMGCCPDELAVDMIEGYE